MKFNRVQAKWDARADMAAANPNPMGVTFAFLAASSYLPKILLFLVLVGGVATIKDALMGTILGLSYYPMGLMTGPRMLLLIFILILTTLFSAVLSVGYTAYAMHLARRERGGYQDLLDAFGMAGRAILTDLLVTLYMSLWLILPCALMAVIIVMTDALHHWFGGVFLILFGGLILATTIWLSMRYALVRFFLVDNPTGSIRSYIRDSVNYTRGRKWELFVLILSFFGWNLLSSLTMGLVGLWVYPYQMSTEARFYDFVTGREEMSSPETYPTPFQ